MAIQCQKCGRCVEPSEEAMRSKICGFCSGVYGEDDLTCFDGSPCDRPDQNCNACEWMGGGL